MQKKRVIKYLLGRKDLEQLLKIWFVKMNIANMFDLNQTAL